MAQKLKQQSQRHASQSVSPTWFDKLTPLRKDFVCVAALLVIVYVVFFKIIASNMVFADSGDTAAAEAWGKGIEYLNEIEHEDPLWIPFVFSGMPLAGAMYFPHNVNYAESLIQLPARIVFLNADLFWFPFHYFLMGLFTYLLARQLKFSYLPSLFAGIMVMLTPYAIGLAPQGHGSKLVTLSYVPLVFLLTYTLFEKRNVLSFALLAAATGTLLLSGHPQIAFYGLLMIGCYALYEIILNARKEPGSTTLKVGLFVLALVIGFGIYTYQYLPTQQYTPYSIRGGGAEAGTSGGLTYDYATNWSFHPLEMLTYIIPSFFGFSSSYITDWQGVERALPLYWGWMPFTEGPVYAGIVPIVFAIFAIVYRRNLLAWFFIAFSILVFFVSFGKYLSIVYNLLFNYLPYFNKFRAPSMILYLIPLTLALLAASGMNFVIELPQRKEFNLAVFRKRLLTILGVLGGLLVLVVVGRSGLYGFLSDFMFSRQGEAQQYGEQVLNVFREKRFDLFCTDYVKMTLLVGAALGLIVVYVNRKLSQVALASSLIVLLLIDLWWIDTKFINPIPKATLTERFQGDPTLQQIQKESESSLFRVFPAGQFDQENVLMYNHIQSMIGYSPAKLKIYQEMIDSCLSGRANMNIFKMLNVKYFVAQQPTREGTAQTISQFNPDYLPRAWFVDTAVTVRSKAEVFSLMNDSSWNPKASAILEKPLPSMVGNSEGSTVSITSYSSHAIGLNTSSLNQALLVLSEIYYPPGWKAYVDGKETEIFKTNYILRSVVVPAGQHTVEFKLDLPVYQIGYTVTNLAWGVTIILLIVGLTRIPIVRQKLGMKEPKARDMVGEAVSVSRP